MNIGYLLKWPRCENSSTNVKRTQITIRRRPPLARKIITINRAIHYKGLRALKASEQCANENSANGIKAGDTLKAARLAEPVRAEFNEKFHNDLWRHIPTKDGIRIHRMRPKRTRRLKILKQQIFCRIPFAKNLPLVSIHGSQYASTIKKTPSGQSRWRAARAYRQVADLKCHLNNKTGLTRPNFKFEIRIIWSEKRKFENGQRRHSKLMEHESNGKFLRRPPLLFLSFVGNSFICFCSGHLVDCAVGIGISGDCSRCQIRPDCNVAGIFMWAPTA